MLLNNNNFRSRRNNKTVSSATAVQATRSTHIHDQVVDCMSLAVRYEKRGDLVKPVELLLRGQLHRGGESSDYAVFVQYLNVYSFHLCIRFRKFRLVLITHNDVIFILIYLIVNLFFYFINFLPISVLHYLSPSPHSSSGVAHTRSLTRSCALQLRL